MATKLTRRDFMKLGTASMLGLSFRDYPPVGSYWKGHAPSFDLGRAVYSVRYYDRPSFGGTELGFYNTDAVVNIREEAIGDPGNTKNPHWLRTDDGWIHGAYIQPVKNILNTPVLDIAASGMLVEVSVPFTQSYTSDNNNWKRKYRFYYKSTYWVYHVFTGVNDVVWYEVLDDRNGGYYYVEAQHLRPVSPEELTPLSQGVPGKRIEVDLTGQRVTAFESDQPVFTTRTATGYFEGDTPSGDFVIERKQPSRHMATETVGNPFDLPGVPWVCYISWTGVSLHGTYWHNNFGVPQSHGCINLTPEAALWLYRWSDPFVPPGEDYIETDNGTQVTIY